MRPDGDIQQITQRLELKIFQLNNLFEIARELHSSLDSESVMRVLMSATMGHALVSRCAVLTLEGGRLFCSRARGCHASEKDELALARLENQPILSTLAGVVAVPALPNSPLRQVLMGWNLAHLVPMRTRSACLGAIAVGERRVGGPLSAEDLEFVSMLATEATAALENLRLHQQMLEKQRLEQELAIAREIQLGLLPRGLPHVEGFEFGGEFQPSAAVGGDYYDVVSLPDGRIALTIGDVAGKGTPASLLMASVQASVRALALSNARDVPGFMARLNRLLYESVSGSRYATFFYGELEPSERRFRYSNAGHLYPLRLTAAGEVDYLVEGGFPLGLFGAAAYEKGTRDLRPGDVMVLYTDGVTEAYSTAAEEFGQDRLVRLVREASALPASALARQVAHGVRSFVGDAPQKDDITVLVMKVLGP